MRHLLAATLVAFTLSAPFAQAEAPIKQGLTATTMNLLGVGVGVEGYDPVSYWPEGGSKPVQGTIKLSFEYNGVLYRFASAKNLATFKANPDHFLPQYGGYCAWAIGAINQRVDVNPHHFVVRDGKLYLFFSDANVVTRDIWKKEAASLIDKGDANYGKLLAQ